MIKIDLITGFLGTGKTTFIHHYAKYLIDEGYKIGIIENDFGAVNVDTMLLADLIGDNCEVEQIVGGNTCCEWKRRFRAKLISMGMRGFNRIIVEPSGIYDVDEFFDVLYDEPIDSWYEKGNVIALVDAQLCRGIEELKDSATRFLLASQVANAGRILLTRSDVATEEERSKTIASLNGILTEHKCNRRLEDSVIARSYNELTDKDYKELSQCGTVIASYEKKWFDQNDAFVSKFFMNVSMDAEKLKTVVNELFSDEKYGEIMRIKGFVTYGDIFIEINACQDSCNIKSTENGQAVLIVIGQNLEEKLIEQVLS